MLRISSRCLVAFKPSSEMRVLKRLGVIHGRNFEIEFQFHINPSPPMCQRQKDVSLVLMMGRGRSLENLGVLGLANFTLNGKGTSGQNAFGWADSRASWSGTCPVPPKWDRWGQEAQYKRNFLSGEPRPVGGEFHY
jgi:hypothetical protein